MEKPLKIGIVCYPSIGGSGVVATNLGKELADLGHEIHFISYERPFKLDPKKPWARFHQVNINEYSLFKYPDYTLPLAETILNVQKKYRLDILHVHYAVPHATAALFAKRMMKSDNLKPPKIITTLHGTDITLLATDPNLDTVIKYSVEKSDGVTSVSQNLKNETIHVLKTKKPIEVIYNFYNPSPITKSRDSVRKGLRIKDDDFLAIHLSNLRPVKRIPDLLKIVGELKKEKKFKLLILGGGSFDQYQTEVKKLGIQKQVIVKHNVLDIQNYLNAADLGIYTSQTESFGMGMLETMVYGKPVLATLAGGIPEVAIDGETGYLLRIGDIKGFAKKIKLLMANPLLLKTLGTQAQARAHSQFCSTKIVGDYLNYYRKILKT